MSQVLRRDGRRESRSPLSERGKEHPIANKFPSRVTLEGVEPTEALAEALMTLTIWLAQTPGVFGQADVDRMGTILNPLLPEHRRVRRDDG